MKKYIKNSFNEQTLNVIYSNLENFFKLFVNILIRYEFNIKNPIKENIKEYTINAGLIQQLLSYLEHLALNNMAILHIIVEFFSKTYDFQTNHICSEIQISDNNENIKFNFVDNSKTEYNNDNHKCKCYFLTLLLRIWDEKLDKNLDKSQIGEKEFNIDKIFVAFLKSYKFKVIYAFSYFSLIDTILQNKSEHIRSLSIQVMTIENIAEKLVSEEKLIFNFYEKLKNITEECLKETDDESKFENQLNDLFNNYYEFYLQTYYLCKPKPAKFLSTKFYILKVLIDIVSMIQNSNKLKTTTTFQREGYDEHFLYIEFYFLQMFSLLVSNMDYSDIMLTKELVFYLIDKIIFEDYNIKLESEEYSFHIPLNRALGILLNRIFFNYQEYNNLSFIETLKELIYEYYNSLSFNEKELQQNERIDIDLEIKFDNSSELIKGDSNINIEKSNSNFESCEFNKNKFFFNNDFICKIDSTKNINKEKSWRKNIFQISDGLHKKKFPNNFEFNDILKKILAPTIRFISFLNSISCDKWVFYGENMTFYYSMYGLFEIFSLPDLILIKMISFLDKEGDVFTFEYFLRETNYNGLYSEFLNLTFIKENIIGEDFITNKVTQLKKLNNKNFAFLLKNLEFCLKLFIPESYNNAFIRLFTFSLQKFNDNRIEDSVFEKLIIREYNNLKKLVKINLIHIIFSQENSIYFSEILKALPFYLKKLFADDDEIDNILNEIADCYQAKNKPNVYKLKPAFFNSLDLFSYLDPQIKSNAEKHYLEFAKDKFPIINSPEDDIFDNLKIFEMEFFEKFFGRTVSTNLNNEFKFNFEFLFNYLKMLIKYYKKLEISDSFIFIFMKFFSLFLNFYKKKYILCKCNYNLINSVGFLNRGKNLFDEKIILENMNYFKEKILSKEFLYLLENNSDDKLIFSFACKYLLNQIYYLFPEQKDKKNKEEYQAKNSINLTGEKMRMNIAKRKQELIKQKYQQKSELALKQYSISINSNKKSNDIFLTESNAKSEVIEYDLNLNEDTNNLNHKLDKKNIDRNLKNDNQTNKDLKKSETIIIDDKNKLYNYSNKHIDKISSINNKELSRDKYQDVHCIVCKNEIQQKDIYNNPFGRIGILNSSSFIFNSKYQTIKHEYEKVIFKNKFVDFQTTSLMNNLNSNIFNNNLNGNSIFNSNIGQLNNQNNIKNTNFNSHFSGTFNNTESIDNDLYRKDSQIMFSQINNQTFVMNVDENILLKKIMLNFKKNSKDLKKSIRFTTCNHFIHFSCYTKSLHSYVNLDSKKLWFSCPLCKSVSNCIFPEMDINLNYVNPETDISEDINEGMTFAELFRFLNEKSEKEIDVDYFNSHLTIEDVFGKFSVPRNLVFVCEDFIEKIISFNHIKFILKDFNVLKTKGNNEKSLINNSLNSKTNKTKQNISNTSTNLNNNDEINNFNEEKNQNITSNFYSNQEKYYDTLKYFFINSLSLLDILRDDDFSKELSIIRTFILSLRILIKSGSLQFGIFLNRFWNCFYFFKTQIQKSENLVNYVDNDIVSNNFFELLMLILSISNTSEYAYFYVLFKHYFPLFLLQFLIREFYKNFNFKTSNNNFEKYFSVDELLFMLNSPQYSKDFKEYFNFYLRKLTILSKIHEENFNEVFLNKYNNPEDEFAYYTKELGFEDNFDLNDLLKDNKEFYPSFWKNNLNSMEFIVEIIKNYHKFKLKHLIENPDGEVDGNLI